MAIYISKNAIKNIPDEARSSYTSNGGNVLFSNHFKNSPFFNNLVNQSQGADFLEEGDTGNHVKLLQTAINTFTESNGILLNTSISGVFDQSTINAIKGIQTVANLPVTGDLDSETLKVLDRQLARDIIYDTETGKTFNNSTSNNIIAINNTNTPIQTYVQPNQNSKLGPKIQPKQTLTYTSSNHSDYGIVTFHDSVSINLENPNLNKKNRFFVKNNQLEFPNITEAPEPGAELITVQPDESLVSIIYNKYYGEEYHILKNPVPENPDDPRNDISNPENIIHTFPKRDLEKDTRLKFIVNLLLYVNSDEDQNIHNIKLLSQYKRYTDQDIDDLNIYDNEGYNLNYQLFLEKLQEKDPEYDWQFINEKHDVNGISYNFKAPIENIAGKKLWLPSRTYVEGLYYALNVQPKVNRMYKKVTVPNSITEEKPEGDSFFDWITDEAFDIYITTVETTLGIGDHITRKVMETYREAREYFTKMYDWLIATMNLNWDRGFGIQLDAGFAITAPIFGTISPGIELSETAYIWRKVTPEDQITISLFEKSILSGRFEAGYGPELSIGSKKKSGASKVGAGSTKKGKRKTRYELVNHAAAELGITFESRSQYEFNISKDNPALIAMMVALMGNIPLSIVAKNGLFAVMDYFLSASIDPEEYLVHWEVGVFVQGRAYAESSVEFGGNENQTFSNEKGKKDKNLKTSGLFSLLKNLNFTASGETFIKYGEKFTYKAEFKNLPNVYEEGFRMPSKVSLEGRIYVEAGLSLNIRFGKFITRFITGVLDNIIPLIPALNLHTGIALSHNFEYNRKTTPDQHSFLNHYPVANAIYGVFDPNNNITKTVGLKLTLGSLDDPLIAGAEASFWLEFATLKEYVIALLENNDESTGFFTNVSAFMELFNKMTLRKKILIGNGITNRNSKGASKMRTSTGISFRKHYSGFLNFQNSNSIKEFLASLISFSAAVDLEANFEMKEVIQTTKFIYEYLRFVVSKIQFTGEDLIKYEKVELEVSKLIKQTTSEIASITLEESLTPGVLNTIYNNALEKLENMYANEEFSFPVHKLKPYINIIGDFIKMMDKEGILSTIAKSADGVTKTISPYLDEIYSIMETVVLYLIQKSNLNFYLEGNLTTSLSGSAGIALGGTKARLGFSGELGIYNRTDLIKNGEFILALTDSYFDFTNDILSIFDLPSISEITNSSKIGEMLISNSTNKNPANDDVK